MESSSHYEFNAEKPPEGSDSEYWEKAEASDGLFKIHAILSLMLLFPLFFLQLVPIHLAPFVMLFPLGLALRGLKLSHQIDYRKMIVAHSTVAAIYSMVPIAGLVSLYIEGEILIAVMFASSPVLLPVLYMIFSKSRLERGMPPVDEPEDASPTVRTIYYHKDTK